MKRIILLLLLTISFAISINQVQADDLKNCYDNGYQLANKLMLDLAKNNKIPNQNEIQEFQAVYKNEVEKHYCCANALYSNNCGALILGTQASGFDAMSGGGNTFYNKLWEKLQQNTQTAYSQTNI